MKYQLWILAICLPACSHSDPLSEEEAKELERGMMREFGFLPDTTRQKVIDVGGTGKKFHSKMEFKNPRSNLKWTLQAIKPNQLAYVSISIKDQDGNDAIPPIKKKGKQGTEKREIDLPPGRYTIDIMGQNAKWSVLIYSYE